MRTPYKVAIGAGAVAVGLSWWGMRHLFDRDPLVPVVGVAVFDAAAAAFIVSLGAVGYGLGGRRCLVR